MLAPASRRWLLAALVLAGLVAAALWLKEPQGARAERATRLVTEPAVGSVASQEEAAEKPEQAPNPAAEKEWRLEVEIRDENDKPVAGRVYVTNAKGELLSVLDNEPSAPATHKVRGTVNVIAQEQGFRLAPRFLEGITPPATGNRELWVRLEAGREIAGKLVDDLGNPLDRRDAIRLQVRVEPVGSSWLSPQKGPGWGHLTDEEGHWIALSASRSVDSRFKIVGLPPGLYRLSAETRFAESLLPPEAPPLVEAGATDVVLVLRRAIEIRVKFVDLDTGKPLDGVGVGWEETSEKGEFLSGGSGSYGSEGLVLYRPRGATFTFQAEAESYETPQPVRVSVNTDGHAEELTVGFRREAGSMADLELLVRDDAGAPAFPLMAGRSHSSRRYCPEDGRYVLKVPAGTQRIELRSPGDQILLFKREWIPSMHDPDDFPAARAYLPCDIEIEIPRGGRAIREVTVQRAALIWVRQEPKGAFSGVRLLRGDTEVKHALRGLYEDKGLVAAVEPGTYTVEGRAGETVVKVEVAAEAAKVAEVWLRAESTK